MEHMCEKLAEKVSALIPDLKWQTEFQFGADSETVDLPFRAFTEDEIKGTIKGAQRFIAPKIYDDGMPELCEKITTRSTNKDEVQAI